MVKPSLSIYVCVLILFHLSFCYGDIVEVPPLNVTQQDLLKLISLGDIKINISALYVFGDSFVDNGNNKVILGNADPIGGGYFPFGIDFDGKATGRITNGRVAVDFIATAAGLPFPPPIMSMSEMDRKTIRTGVNYGSASAGLLPENGRFLGKHVINFFQQVDLFENSTMEALRGSFDCPESFAEYLSKSVFYINLASNDLGITYEFDMHDKYPDVNEYVKLLIEELSKQLRRLHALGARKFLVTNVPPLGCQPFNIHMRNHTGPCVEQMNKHMSVYDDLLPGLLTQLQSTLPGSKFVLGDIYKVFRDVIASPESYGFTDVSTSCCFDKNGTKFQVCAPNIAPCEDRKTHMFFDPFHPSEAMYFVWARRFLKDNSVCTPITLIELMQA
ncbi:GDSL-motif lipase 7 [Hibiscus trionum]|uniref:GDSL-motif lipase 7 n=1 Tax=Hibiscus trionum TaxID=183268 RepID=A0A9W7I5J5_HIBTR|nr:GDSL-motif lipase 7 [Hibiscus trionum]